MQVCFFLCLSSLSCHYFSFWRLNLDGLVVRIAVGLQHILILLCQFHCQMQWFSKWPISARRGYFERITIRRDVKGRGQFTKNKIQRNVEEGTGCWEKLENHCTDLMHNLHHDKTWSLWNVQHSHFFFAIECEWRNYVECLLHFQTPSKGISSFRNFMMTCWVGKECCCSWQMIRPMKRKSWWRLSSAWQLLLLSSKDTEFKSTRAALS